MKKYIAYFIVFLFIGVIIWDGCKKSSSDSTFTITGSVVSETNSPISNAKVTCGTASVLTDATGSFTLTNVSSSTSAFSIAVTSNGYFTGYKNLDNIDGSSLNATITLIAKSALGTLPTTGGSVGSTGLRVVAPAGAFKNADNSVYNGPVTVSSRYIKGDDANMSNLMPGGDFMAKDKNGNDGAMITYGFVATEFKDINGNLLTPGSNVKVAVTVPAGVDNPVTAGAKSWGYDGQKWTGQDTTTQTGSEFFFPATTEYQNIDVCVLQFGTIEGTVVCTDGKPAPFIQVTLTSPPYVNKYTVVTNKNGKYRAKVAVKDGAIIFHYQAVATGGTGNVSVSDVPVGGSVTAPNITTSTCGGGGTTGTTGTFSFNGQNYSGTCTPIPSVGSGCTGHDVPIVTTSGASFIVYNMPSGSSGSYTINDGYTNAMTCVLYVLLSDGSGHTYGSKNGTLTKTGSNTYTVTGSVYDISTSTTYSVSASGSY